EKRHTFSLADEEVTTLACWCARIEDHYGKRQDLEWAKDGRLDKLFVVQARPETVHSAQDKQDLKQYSLETEGEVITAGHAIGDKIAAGKARILHSPEEADQLQEGEVLVAKITNPDWDPIIKKASAIITDSGGRTSHAAIVARELETVAVVGTKNATETIEDGQEVTVSAAEGQQGKIYEGILEWDEKEISPDKLGDPETEIMLILADPHSGYQYADYPVDGVGLLRLEFAINNTIKIHPMALAKYDELKNEEVQDQISKLTAAWKDKKNYFIEKLSMAVGTIAACFYPRPVIVRMSDFKSNEYAGLVGGEQFETKEANPMLGFRGAARYHHENYREAFRLECQAMRVVREDMGLENVKLMIPFCRTVEEGEKVLDVMSEYHLKQGENGLEIYVMSELPSNVIGAERF